jgi:hypothetical protein
MGTPLRREEGSDYYWSLPLYWGVILLALTPIVLLLLRKSVSCVVADRWPPFLVPLFQLSAVISQYNKRIN